MKTMWMTGLAAGLAAGFASVATAQAVVSRPYEFNQQTYQFVSGQLASGPTVKGAPYSAEAVNETIQTLADGNRIVQRTSAMQYRDADGRERRDETSAMGIIFIIDRLIGARYALHPDSQTAEKIPLPSDGTYQLFLNDVAGVRVARAGREPVKVAIAAPGGRGGSEDALKAATLAGVRLATGSNDSKVEQLGNMFIEGVQAQGTRTTTTIPAGQIGNERPIDIVDESWYSPDLKMTIMTKHSDPRSGETNFALKNINRSNPPPTLFEVPSDYTVKAVGGRGGANVTHPVVMAPAQK